jgi:hypothetical protein
MESIEERLARRQLATMLISCAHNHVDSEQRRVLSVVVDELLADVADADRRGPAFGALLDVYLELDVWHQLRQRWLTAAAETLMRAADPTVR